MLKTGPLHTVSDLRDRRLGVGTIWASGGYQLCVEELLHHGFNLYADAAQVIFYGGDYTRQMEAVLRGEADAGFMLSGWMEANFPQNVPLFRWLDPSPDATYQGEPFPFPTSTALVPNLGVSAAPDVPWTLQQQVANALGALNGTEAAGAGIAGFTLAASYAATLEIAARVGVAYRSSDRGTATCHSPFADPYTYVFCPPGFMKDAPKIIALSCKRRRLACPPNLVCVCRPCVPVLAVRIFPSNLVLGLCTTLLVAALALTVGWRALLDATTRTHNCARLRRPRHPRHTPQHRTPNHPRLAAYMV